MKKITIYTGPVCNFCDAAKRLLKRNNASYSEINIAEIDDEAKKFPIITKVQKNVTLNSVMSNSFGFGGTNATLIFEKV